MDKVSAETLDAGDRFTFNHPDSENARLWEVVNPSEKRERSPGYWAGSAKTVDGGFQLTADIDERENVYPIKE